MWDICVLLIFVIFIAGKVCTLLTGYSLSCVVSSVHWGSVLYVVYVPVLFSVFNIISV
jgi:hypothetical protein